MLLNFIDLDQYGFLINTLFLSELVTKVENNVNILFKDVYVHKNSLNQLIRRKSLHFAQF